MRRRTRLLVAGAVVVALGLGGLLAGVVAELGPAGAAPAGPAIDPGTVLSGFGRDSGTATTVAQLEGELARSGPDADRLDDLGLAYQVRWRETGDAAFLPLSERALRGVLSLRPKDATATLALGNLALIRHDFRGALALGREAHRRAPVRRAAVRRRRRRAGRARPLSRRVRDVRPDGRAQAERRLVRASRVRPRAPR